MKMQSVPVAETLQSEHFSLHTNFQPLSFHFLRKNRAIFRNLNQHSNCIEQKNKNKKKQKTKKNSHTILDIIFSKFAKFWKNFNLAQVTGGLYLVWKILHASCLKSSLAT